MSARTPRRRFFSPLADLARSQVFPGLLLVACAAVAIALANLPTAHWWLHLWETPLSISLGPWALSKSVLHWINDGLMVLFFFFVGLEIKHEMLDGQLSTWRQAALPVMAALGGMVVPAALYAGAVALHPDGAAYRAGWGIPMATDIAFALGVLALLGKRVPASLKVFLAALAIADDLGAVLVIALFYTDDLAWGYLVSGFGLIAMAFAANRLGVRKTWPYALIGVLLWLTFLQSGVHATIAGVALALAIPARRQLDAAEFSQRGRELLDEFSRAEDGSPLTTSAQLELVQELAARSSAVQAPLQRMEHALAAPVAHVIVPLFALANAGVSLAGGLGEAARVPSAQGVALGLLIGKPLGVFGATWLAVRFGLSRLPAGVTWRHVHGAAWLAGIGFTMSLFVDTLAFGQDNARAFDASKIAILLTSTLAGVIGYLLLHRAGGRRQGDEAAG